jgi:hypothetical protein
MIKLDHTPHRIETTDTIGTIETTETIGTIETTEIIEGTEAPRENEMGTHMAEHRLTQLP